MFYIIVLLSIMSLIGTDLFVPSLPQIAHIFSQTTNATQMTISLFLLGFSLSQIFYGPISDFVGRRKTLMVGVLIFTLGALVCISAHSFLMFCMGRVLQGLGAGSGLCLSRVILRDSYKGTLLAVRSSQLAMFVSLTPALAPFIGGILATHFDFQSSFIFMFIYGLVVFLLLLFIFKETNLNRNKNFSLVSICREYCSIMKCRTFMSYTIIAGIAFTSIILYVNVLPFIIQGELKLSPFTNGFILLFAALGISFSSFLSSRLVSFVNSIILVNVGLICLTFAGFLLVACEYLFGTSLYSIIPSIFLITMGCGFVFPNAIAVCFTNITTNFGAAGAIYGFLQIFISMVMNFILNNIEYQTQGLLGSFYILIGLSGLLICFMSRQYKISSNIKLLQKAAN